MLRPNYDALRNEIIKKRAEGVRRQDASDYVCRKLLFELGEPPNAKTVREITEWGSITDVQDDVRAFYDSLKNPGGTPFPGSGVPASLQLAFAQNLAELAQHASAEADASFDETRRGFDEERAALHERERRLAAEIEALIEERTGFRAELQAAGQREQELDKRIELLVRERQTVDGRLEALQQQLTKSLKEHSALQRELVEKTAAFAQTIRQAESVAENRRQPLMRELDAARQQVLHLDANARAAQAKIEESMRELISEQAARRLLETTVAARDELLASRTAQLEGMTARIADLQDALAAANLAAQQAGAREEASLARELQTRAELRDAEKRLSALQTAESAAQAQQAGASPVETRKTRGKPTSGTSARHK